MMQSRKTVASSLNPAQAASESHKKKKPSFQRPTQQFVKGQ
jgi:hypothetical protein